MRILRWRNTWRKWRRLYPLSPTSRVGRNRGRPGPSRLTWPRFSRSSATVASCCWPGVRTEAIRLPWPSTRTWILVLRPPRPRPKASASGVLFCPGSMLMGADYGAIHKVDSPIHLATLVAHTLEFAQDAFPHARLTPALKPTVDAGPFPITFGPIAPGCPWSRDPQHPLHHHSMVMRGASRTRFLGRQQVFQPLPLFVT
jgi:hypothetical protein